MSENHDDAGALSRRILDAWNSQDVERVLDCYTDDVRYRDPNTRGWVEGREAFGRYLTRLFERWEMLWRERESYRAVGIDGYAALWSATLRARGADSDVAVDGMDLVVFRDGRICRNEVYFDRSVLVQ